MLRLARPSLETTERLLGALVLAVAGVAASTFLLSAAARLAWPYEIEWLESELLQHAARAAAGQPLYAPPSSTFAPTIYPPLYAWLAGLVVRATGEIFFAPRLVSVIATLAAAFLVARAAGSLSGSLRGGLLGAALLLSGYVPCGTVFDLARLDALWVALLLGGTTLAAAAERAPSAWRGAVAGLVLGCATAAKQPAALFALVLGALLLWRGRRAGLALLATWALVTSCVYGGLHLATSGWSTTYLVTMPLSVPHRPSAFLHLFRDDALGWFAPAILIVLLRALTPRDQRAGGAIPLAWLAGIACAFAATLSMRTLQGGSENTLVPAVAFGSVAVGAIAGGWLREGAPATRLLLLSALLLQFGRLFFSPGALVPAPAERARAETLVARIRAIEGAVWIPSHTSYAVFAGKDWFVHRDPLLDLQYTGRAAPAELVERIRAGAFAAIIVDGPFVEPALENALQEAYREVETIDDPPTPLVGYRTRPSVVFRPR